MSREVGNSRLYDKKELQREKLRSRAGERVWGFEKKLEERRRSEIARKCWEDLKGKCKRKRDFGMEREKM